MGWSVGEHNGRDIGYGVPALCDHPGCSEEIDRGLSYVCGNDVYGGKRGCGLFFCDKHRTGPHRLCSCCARRPLPGHPFDPKPDLSVWMKWKLTDESWARWRAENPEKVQELEQAIAAGAAP